MAEEKNSVAEKYAQKPLEGFDAPPPPDPHNQWVLEDHERDQELVERGIFSGKEIAAKRTQRHLEMEEGQFIDPLTKLRNRRYLAQELPRIIDAANREGNGQVTFVAMLDVDHFKQINDKLGHPVGDAVLKALAESLIRTPEEEKKLKEDPTAEIPRKPFTRGTDLVVRWGGEEIVIIGSSRPNPNKPATEEELMQAAAEHLEETRKGITEFIRSKKIPDLWDVTASLGYTFIKKGADGKTQDTSDQLIEDADLALLFAKKKQGRNVGVRYNKELEPFRQELKKG